VLDARDADAAPVLQGAGCLIAALVAGAFIMLLHHPLDFSLSLRRLKRTPTLLCPHPCSFSAVFRNFIAEVLL
jgi:hypothetical protein